MIDTIIFDLDGTLVQTEKLKAISYAKAAVELCPKTLSEEVVLEAFKDVVGLPRQQVATTLMTQFDLEYKARARMQEFDVSIPWQSFVQVRLNIYHEMLADPNTILNNQWPYTITLLKAADEQSCKLGLATMSHRKEAMRVLRILDLTNVFDFIATREDVQEGKPNPEIYNLAMAELGSSPETTLIIEDSPAGVQAALNSKATVIAVATPFTSKRLHTLEGLAKDSLVDDPAKLMGVVNQTLQKS